MNQQSDKKDIIVSGFSNYGMEKLTPWLNSIERCGFTGDILCVMYGNNPNMLMAKEILSNKKNIKIIEGTITKSVLSDRYKDIKNYLLKNIDKYRLVFSTDNDVIFQLNPSNYVENKLKDTYDIICGSESLIHKDEKWANSIMKEAFPDAYDFMKDKIIYNAGTISGKIEKICELFEDIYQLSVRPKVDCDQAAYNLCIHTKYKDNCYFSGIEDGYATQCNTTANPRLLVSYNNLLLEKPILKDGVAYNSKMEKTCLLHQYQNVPGFYEEVLKLYA